MVLTFDEFKHNIRVPDSLESSVFNLVKSLGHNNATLKSMGPGTFLFKVGYHHLLVLDPDSRYDLVNKLQEEYPKQILGGYVFFYITGQAMDSDFIIDGDYLVSIFKFDSFEKCKKFITDILELAYRFNHYPVISYDGNTKVTVKLTTHDSGSVTEKDTKMAIEISKIKNRINDILD